MKDFVEKLIPLEREIAAEKGPFVLFALFLREDSLNLWDWVVSAPWIDADEGRAIRYLADKLKPIASMDEMMRLSRIAPIESDNPGLEALSAFRVEHGLVEVQHCEFFGLEIRHAYIITSAPKIAKAAMANRSTSSWMEFNAEGVASQSPGSTATNAGNPVGVAST